jgi:hypothetical protein
VSCVACLAEGTTDLAGETASGSLIPGTTANRPLNACQQAVEKQTALLLQQRTRILQRCWDLRLRGKHADTCPNGGAAPKTAARKAFDDLAKADQKSRAAICRACGGRDKTCDGTNDFTVAAIGFAGTCADVVVPTSGESCAAGGSVDTLAELAQCVGCTARHVADCSDRAAVPALAAYPEACDPPPAAPCTSAEVTIGVAFAVQPPEDFVAGVQSNLAYPGTRLDIPGSGTASSVAGRVTNLTGVGGSLISAADLNVVPDAFDDQINVGMANIGTALPPGDFVRIAFDCRPGEPAPSPGSFTCSSSVSTFGGQIIASSCSVTALSVTP